MSLDTSIIQILTRNDRLAFKRHCLLRMHQRSITADEVKNAILNDDIIEAYPDDFPLPSGLLLGYTENQRPVHAVIALDDSTQMVWIITVYEPSPNDWGPGFRTRR